MTAVGELIAEHGDAELARWWHDGVDAFLAGDGSTLDAALGIDRAALLGERDRHLRAAFAALPADCSPTARVRALARAVRLFESSTWPRVRSLSEPPSRLTPLQRALFHAFRLGVRIPTSERQLYHVCVVCSDSRAIA